MTLLDFVNIPASIKESEIDIGNPPGEYEAFIYEFTNLHNGKKYIGSHKGKIGDGYWHSSESEEFNKVFSSETEVLQYKILRYGSWSFVQSMETRLLRIVDASKNSLYYNRNKGMKTSTKGTPPDVVLVNELVTKIENKDGLVVTYEKTKDVAKLKKLQVRFEEDKDHRREIKERINDAGNTSKCSPVVVYEGRGKHGEDIVGDGNHTILGALDSKHGAIIPIVRIPKNVHEIYTDEELNAVGNLLNKKPDVVKKPVTINDAVKQLEMSCEGVSLEDFEQDEDQYRKLLKTMGFTGDQIKRIFKKVKESIIRGEFLKKNKLWIDWSLPSHNQHLVSTVEAFKTSTQTSISLTSKMIKWDNIVNALYTEEVLAKAQGIKPKKKMMVVVHHKSPGDEKDWKINLQPRILNMIDWLFTNQGFEITLYEMPTTMTNNPFLKHE